MAVDLLDCAMSVLHLGVVDLANMAASPLFQLASTE
jgi:hypothetical protein